MRDARFKGVAVFARDGAKGRATGGVRRCGVEDCAGTRIRVAWPATKYPDALVTWPCTGAMTERQDGWHIHDLRRVRYVAR